MAKKIKISHEIIEKSEMATYLPNQILSKYDIFLCNSNLDEKQKEYLTKLIGTMCWYVDRKGRFKYSNKINEQCL